MYADIYMHRLARPYACTNMHRDVDIDTDVDVDIDR